jgi:hypothetical protein
MAGETAKSWLARVDKIAKLNLGNHGLISVVSPFSRMNARNLRLNDEDFAALLCSTHACAQRSHISRDDRQLTTHRPLYRRKPRMDRGKGLEKWL